MTTIPDPPEPTSLELPDSETETPQPAGPEPTGPDASGGLGDLFAAQMQRVEIAMLSRILATTLAGALPPSMVRVERRRTLGQRLNRQPESVIGVSVNADDKTLTFRAPAVGDIQATVSHTVHGVALSTARLTVPEWLSQLAAVLNAASDVDDATQAALQRALLS